MGSEVFRLKSLNLDDTLVRGARVNFKNAQSTKTLIVNNGDDSVLKSGETGINREYVVEASLVGNDLKGSSTVTNNSDVVRSYDGPSNISNGDLFRFSSDHTFYGVTGIQGTDIYLTAKYTKEETIYPDVQTGACVLRKVKINSVKYETVTNNEGQDYISYDKNKTDWGITGIHTSGPYIMGVTGAHIDTALDVKLQTGIKKDLVTIGSVYKTLVNNNSSPLTDISLSPLPYPHESLQVYYAPAGGALTKQTEYENYVVNYSQNPELQYPYPPYEERSVAYIRFLDKIVDEVQVSGIGSDFNGQVQLVKKSNQPGNLNLTTSVQDIMPSKGFSIKVGGTEGVENAGYIPNYSAGLVTFVQHQNEEQTVDSIVYPKNIIWDGLSIIKGVGETGVQDFSNLVIPGIQGIEGTTGTVYYEDTDANNLIRDTDFQVDFQSGAITLTQPLKETDTVLVSYYVEGIDVENEKIDLEKMRTREYPIVASSMTLTQLYDSTSADGKVVTKKQTLVEDTDYVVSYVTGRINIIRNVAGETTVGLEAVYTPMAQLNCVLQSIPGQTYRYRMTVVDDVVAIKDKDVLLFGINNPVVSVPSKDPFKGASDPTKYSFDGTVLLDSLLSVKDVSSGVEFDTTGYTYDDQSKALKLDTTLTDKRPGLDDLVTATYSFESDLLPYAPLLIFFPVLNEGDSSFVIEGFDRTDVIYPESVIRITNFNPEAVYYFKIRSVTYDLGNTTVELYDTFPQDIQNPTFELIDKPVVWQDLPEGTVIDTGVAVGSEAIILQNNVLKLGKDIKVNTLLLINGTQLYEVQSVATAGLNFVIQLFPTLRNPIQSVFYSSRPVYDQGATEIVPDYVPITDTPEPAFMLSYKAPAGFEGGAKILIDKEKIVLYESIGGIQNPSVYEYKIADYPTVYGLAKAIMGTASTYKTMVPGSGVPDYNPFTIAPDGAKEDYYLSEGIYRSDLLVPFEDATPINLPYTFNISTEVRKYTLLQLTKNQTFFDIYGADQTTYIIPGNVIAFQSKYRDTIEYHEILKAELVEEGSNTRVSVKDKIKANDIDPNLLKIDNVEWVSLSYGKYAIQGIDYENATITWAGQPSFTLRKGQLFKIDDKFVYKIKDTLIDSNSYQVTLDAPIDISVRSYYNLGYIKVSAGPVLAFETGEQPYLMLRYQTPKNHTGYAVAVIDDVKLTLTETLDNFTNKSSVFKFSDYALIDDLLIAIKDISSIVTGEMPFGGSSVSSEGLVTGDYRLTPTTGLVLDTVIYLAPAAFSISYFLPGTDIGEAVIRVTSTAVEITETVKFRVEARTVSHTSVLAFSDSKNLKDLVLNVIPKIPSLKSGTTFPYTTVLLNTSFFDEGYWNTITLSSPSSLVSMPTNVYGSLKQAYFGLVGILNEKRLTPETDYKLDAGTITLTTPMMALDRYKFSYMGLDPLAEDEGKGITCTCRFFKTLDTGSRVDVYLDYLNIDQFYLQKLTERKFSEIVVVPQIQEIVNQKGSGGGFGSDSGASDEGVANWDGGSANDYYYLRDELIKKQLYLKFYQWYKSRLRDFSAELQMILGFRYAHSNAIGTNNGSYTLEDTYVEDDNYTLTRTTDFNQAANGFNKFFPIGYDGAAPQYYDRFGVEYKTFNEVYCCNVKYLKDGVVTTVGIVKSESPYWNRSEELDYNVWLDKYINENLVGSYKVAVPSSDRTFSSSSEAYSFLRTLNTGDSVRIDSFNAYYTIDSIGSPVDYSTTPPTAKTYEYLVLAKPFTEKGVRLFDLTKMTQKNKDKEVIRNKDGSIKRISFDELLEKLPPDGYKVWIKRVSPESFPMYDDNGSLGASVYGGTIEGLIKHMRKIKKPYFKYLMTLLFPFLDLEDPTKKFRVMVKKDPDAPWETADTIDMSKLSFKEERNLDDVMDALRFDFTKKYSVGSVDVYDIKEKSTMGLHRYFYLSVERVYDAGSKDGYYDCMVFRAKNRNWWFRIEDEGEQDIVEDYGFKDYAKDSSAVYENFYDPNNLYKALLKEKQAWETESLIVKDLYDFNDKLARAFKQGNLNQVNSLYQGYLAKPYGSATDGISDILKNVIPSYESYLLFLLNTGGPVQGIISPDHSHDEDAASPEIIKSYNDAKTALSYYQNFYNLEKFYENLNNDNNNVWRNDYIRWCLSVQPGVIYQKEARRMYESDSSNLTVGLSQATAIGLNLYDNGRYTLSNAQCTLGSDYNGKFLQITAKISGASETFIFYLYKSVVVDTVTSIVYKTIDEIVAEINAYRFDSSYRLFQATNAFQYQENNVLVNTVIDTPVGFDYSIEGYVNVSNVADHRQSDARVLFLDKNIEDRLYTDIIRNQPAFTIKYNGDYYKQALDKAAISIEATNKTSYGPGFVELSYGTFLDEGFHNVFMIKGVYSSFVYSGITTVYTGQGNEDVEYKIPLYEASTDTYMTLQQLVDAINALRAPDGTYHILRASMTYDVTPYGELATSYLTSVTEYKPATDSGSVWGIEQTVHVDESLDDMSQDINQGLYRVYYDENFNKKMEIRFTNVVVNGEEISDAAQSFIFDFNKSDGSFRTLEEFATLVNDFVYKQEKLFVVTVIYPDKPKEELSTRYVVADNKERFLGYDQETTLYADIFIQKTQEGTESSRDTSQSKNAYFAYPFYTSNGNKNKEKIDGIPVAGSWDLTNSEQILEIRCKNGAVWELTFRDYTSGDLGSYMIPEDILNAIEKGTVSELTPAKQELAHDLLEKPSVTILKDLVLTRKSVYADKVYVIPLRKYTSINDLATVINTEKRGNIKDTDLTGLSDDFVAVVRGTPEVQGEYKSFEVDAKYIPVVNYSSTTKKNRLIGWQMASYQIQPTDSYLLTVSNKRYSSGSSFKFNVSPPEQAYEDTLNRMPQGFKTDTLAFDVYCWDDMDAEGHRSFVIKDNWIYFQSQNVQFSFDTDLGQPDKTLGYGIPLAMSGHALADDRESIGTLVSRINGNAQINKMFYANLKFTKESSGSFEYGYLPNYESGVINKAVLDNFYLRDDKVLTLTPNQGYAFTASSYTVHDTADTLDISCDWNMNHTYQMNYDLTLTANSTITNLVSVLNTDSAPILPASVFEAVVVGSHGPDLSTTLLPASGYVTDVSETILSEVTYTFTVDVGLDNIITSQADWQVNDVVRFTTTGVLPLPLVPATAYYVVSATVVGGTVFLKVSGTIGGPVINILGAGSGIHTIHAYRILVVQADWQVNDIVRFTTTGTLPAPLALVTDYYVVSIVSTLGGYGLRVSGTIGGSGVHLSSAGTGVNTITRVYKDLMAGTVSSPYSAIQLRVRNSTGANFTVLGAYYSVNATRNQLSVRVSIRYNNTYTLTGYNYSTFTLLELADNLSALQDFIDPIFEPLFVSTVISDSFSDLMATRLKDATGVVTNGTTLEGSLSDVICMKVLNMNQPGTVSVNLSALIASTKISSATALPSNRLIQDWIVKTLKGGYTSGLIAQDILPMVVPGVTYGWLAVVDKTLTSTNTPEHVYFGILGDIKWVQISDQNLHIQLNYVKQRLGMPWKDSTGIVREDYYTPENYNAGNPYAIDFDHFLTWLRTTRFMQIKNSIINENIIQNKYLWIYMKFHKEFGCDQKAIALQKRIASGESDQSIIEGMTT